MRPGIEDEPSPLVGAGVAQRGGEMQAASQAGVCVLLVAEMDLPLNASTVTRDLFDDRAGGPIRVDPEAGCLALAPTALILVAARRSSEQPRCLRSDEVLARAVAKTRDPDAGVNLAMTDLV